MKITETNIDDFIKELTHKYKIREKSLYGNTGRKKASEYKARKELIIYLKVNGFEPKDISRKLDLTPNAVYAILNTIYPKKNKDTYDNKTAIKILIKERKKLEESLIALDIVIKLYTEQ